MRHSYEWRVLCAQYSLGSLFLRSVPRNPTCLLSEGTIWCGEPKDVTKVPIRSNRGKNVVEKLKETMDHR